MNRLSKRLEAVAAMVTTDGVLADVGTDHGYVPIALTEQKRIQKAIAMDLREGPLQRAREHIVQFGLENYIETRQSDGVTALAVGEVQGIVIAGMGGELVIHILQEGRAVCRSARELILQPQSHLAKVRRFLRQEGYVIADEDMVEEDGKFYPMLRVTWEACGLHTEQGRFGAPEEPGLHGESGRLRQFAEPVDIAELEDLYGPVLLRKRHPVLFLFLKRQRSQLLEILQQLKNQPASEKLNGRIQQLNTKLLYNEAARRCYGLAEICMQGSAEPSGNSCI